MLKIAARILVLLAFIVMVILIGYVMIALGTGHGTR